MKAGTTDSSDSAVPPADASPSGKAGSGSFPIVGIGASAGGLEAFSALLGALAPDTGMGFVLVQHLDPQHASALTDLLGRTTSLPVQEVTNNLRIKPNHVYVIPPNTDLGISGGVLTLRPRKASRTPHRSIDHFFEALAQDQRERAIGVVLSGTATDGTMGLEAIKAEGGITFAQDESARHDSMPRSAVAAGCVDFVLAPQAIAQELARIALHPVLATTALSPLTSPLTPAEEFRSSATTHQDDETPLPSGGRGTPGTGARQARRESEGAGAAGGVARTSDAQADDSFKKILLLLRNHAGVDFSLYKSNTIQRRITRRMVLSRQDTPEHYARFLRGNVKELDALYSDVLISVTSFFRNPEAFDVLRHKVLPVLLEQRGDQPVRVWVLGCSTGQEAYSIAMTFVEAAERAPRVRRLQVFATDLNDTLLDKARHGLYAKTLEQDISPERLRRFFIEEEGGYRIVKSLREMVVFARQNVAGDPPFSRMDLISCRNLLIYFEPGLQKKVLPVFHYALKPGGYLMLGASESIGSFTDLFAPVDKKFKIYAKKAAPTPAFQLPTRKEYGAPYVPAVPLPARSAGNGSTAAGSAGLEEFRAEANAQREADRVTVNQYAPPSVLINDDLQILQFRGSTSAYLEPPSGKASFDVLKMAREGLMLPLRAAITQARKENTSTRKEYVQVDGDGGSRTIHVEVIPLKNLRERCFLVVFNEADASQARGRRPAGQRAASATAGRVPGAAVSRRIGDLETELADTRDYLQSVQELHEAANEELQASNEEIQSANEELQSLNEELETSKEELESSNEELTTVNDEMANRNTELNRLNNDLVNVQTSAHLAIVLLGRDLTIRGFSARAEKQLNLLAADVGRPLGRVRHDLDVPDLEAFIIDVIETVRPDEREIRDRNGRWWALRVRPYLTVDNRVDGAVLVLMDIDDLKRNQEAGGRLAAIVESSDDPILSLTLEGVVTSWNRAAETLFGYTAAEAVGQPYLLIVPPERRAEASEGLAQVVRGQPVEHFDTVRLARDGRLVDVSLTISPVKDANERVIGASKVMRVITDRVQGDERLRESERRFREMIDALPVAIYTTDAQGRVTHFNPAAAEFAGRTPVLGTDQWCVSWKLHYPDGAPMPLEECPMADSLRTGREVQGAEAIIERPDGTRRWFRDNPTLLRDAQGEVVGAINMLADITQSKRAEGMLLEAARHKNEFLAMLAHELRNPLAPIRNGLEVIRLERPVTAAGGPGDRVESAVAMMGRQLNHMVRLIDELLDISRIGRGAVELRKEQVELSLIGSDVANTYVQVCESSGIDFTVTLPAGPVYADADPIRLAQIMGNLLSNACKFTRRGGAIRFSLERDDPTGPEAVLRVSDTGIGIESGDLERIFELFTQVDTTLERGTSGLGIGLTLVRNLVALHGGTVEARSAGIGKGSEFLVRLPIVVDTPDAAVTPASGEPAPGLDCRILVVDDNRDSADLLAMILNLRGSETRVAYDGLEAVAVAGTFQPDIVLLDIGLPNLNGFEAARRIRDQSAGNGIVLVALTGWSQEADRQRALEAGFDGYVVKPVDHAVLHQLLHKLLQNLRSS